MSVPHQKENLFHPNLCCCGVDPYNMDHNETESLSVYLQRSHPKLLTTPALSNLRQVVDKALKDVCGIQVTIVVHIDVNHTLGICRKGMCYKTAYPSKSRTFLNDTE